MRVDASLLHSRPIKGLRLAVPLCSTPYGQEYEVRSPLFNLSSFSEVRLSVFLCATSFSQGYEARSSLCTLVLGWLFLSASRLTGRGIRLEILSALWTFQGVCGWQSLIDSRPAARGIRLRSLLCTPLAFFVPLQHNSFLNSWLLMNYRRWGL